MVNPIGYEKYVMSDASRSEALPYMEKKTIRYYNLKVKRSQPPGRRPKTQTNVNVITSILYYGADDGFLYAIDNSGNKIWKSNVSNGVNNFVDDSSPALSSDGTTLYIGTVGSGPEITKFGGVNAIDTSGGSIKWFSGSNVDDRNIVFNGSPKLNSDESVVYIGNFYGLRAFKTIDGNLKWSNITLGTINSSLSLSPDESVIYFGSDNNNLYALNTSDGSIKWNKTFTNKFYSSPIINEDGSIVYIGNSNNNLYAINTIDGSTKWNFETAGGVDSSPVLNPHESVVYIASRDGKLYAINTSNGTENWNYNFNKQTIISTPTLNEEGSIIYNIVYTGILYAINTNTRIKIWEFNANNQIFSSPVLSVDEKTIYISDKNNNIYAVKTKDGKQLWKNTDAGKGSTATPYSVLALATYIDGYLGTVTYFSKNR